MLQRPARIAVLGSINCDTVIRCRRLPQRGETVLAESSLEISGGKGADQAVAASRLGGQVTMVGRVGDDAIGQRLLSGLGSENLDISLVRATPECPTGFATVAVEDSGENSIIVVPGANGRLTADDVAAAADVIATCDVLLVQLEVPLDAVAAAIAVARAKGVRIILNPAPVSGPVPRALLAVDIICPNQLEATALLGRPITSRASALDAARELNCFGSNVAVITLGGDGAVYCDGDRAEWIPPFAVHAVDTTAAGDAFAGALAVHLAEGASLADCVRFAAAAGALAVGKPGAQPSLPVRSEVCAFIKANYCPPETTKLAQ